jgi:hypothetical protein
MVEGLSHDCELATHSCKVMKISRSGAIPVLDINVNWKN